MELLLEIFDFSIFGSLSEQIYKAEPKIQFFCKCRISGKRSRLRKILLTAFLVLRKSIILSRKRHAAYVESKDPSLEFPK